MKSAAPFRWTRWRRDVLATSLALGSATAVTYGVLSRSPDHPAKELAQVLDESLDDGLIPTEVVPASNDGRHLGFDTSEYPGDDAMRAWKAADVNYEWVGYYLPAPCHKDEGWSGKRATLSDMGWGLAVIYVGQQTWGKQPGQAVTRTRWVTKTQKRRVKVGSRYVTRTVRRKVPIRYTEKPRVLPGQTCSAHLVSGPQGRKEANDAIAKTAAEGFKNGTVIFLDVERMDATPQRMRDYYRDWTERVLEDGRFIPGIYAHTHNAQRIYSDVKAVYALHGVEIEPPFWVAGGRDFSPEKAPHEVGHNFAAMWQGVLDVWRTHNGVRLPIDINVAAVPSPSEHLAYITRQANESAARLAE